jgi:hypothetical protein
MATILSTSRTFLNHLIILSIQIVPEVITLLDQHGLSSHLHRAEVTIRAA